MYDTLCNFRLDSGLRRLLKPACFGWTPQSASHSSPAHSAARCKTGWGCQQGVRCRFSSTATRGCPVQSRLHREALHPRHRLLVSLAPSGCAPQLGSTNRLHRLYAAPFSGPELDPDAFTDSYDSDEYEWEHDDFVPAAARPAARRVATKPQQAVLTSGGGGTSHSPVRGVRQHTALEQQPSQSDDVVLQRLAAAGVLVWQALLSVPVETMRAVRVTLEGAYGMMRSTADAGVAHMASQAEQARVNAEHMAAAREQARASYDEDDDPMPDDAWGRLQWLWDRPPVKRLRLTISMAQWSVRLPALLALVATQIGLLASQFSLPMLAPLLLGTGMLLRSIKQNASFLFPRISLLVVLLWAIWFANSVIQNTAVYLRKQGALDQRVSGAIITTSECASLLSAATCILSMLGINVSGLLLPAGIALAIAAKDLSHNFLAGFFLFTVQPFKLGDRLAVSYSTSAAAGHSQTGAWFEGTCEKVDLRYTIIKDGSRRLYMPNSAFITREFIVVDDPAKELKKQGPHAQVERRSHLGHGKPVPGSRYGPGTQPPADWDLPPDAWRGQPLHAYGTPAMPNMETPAGPWQRSPARTDQPVLEERGRLSAEPTGGPPASAWRGSVEHGWDAMTASPSQPQGPWQAEAADQGHAAVPRSAARNGPAYAADAGSAAQQVIMQHGPPGYVWSYDVGRQSGRWLRLAEDPQDPDCVPP